MLVAGSWRRLSRRMQLDDHRRKLVSVVVGRSIFPVMTVC